MKNITLKFNSPNDLIEFIELTETVCKDLNSYELVITCTLSEADLELARSAYHAVIVNEHNSN
jgi:hypothetical protein